MTKDTAVGVKVFSRVDKLSDLLDSIQHPEIKTVYIADDGEQTAEKSKIYDREYPFKLQVFDLPYDAGLGYGRAHIVDNLSEDYLLIVDSDHQLPGDISPLHSQLQEDKDIGGIGGLLYENKKITGSCHDLYERDGLLIRDVKESKPVYSIANHPFIPFDFIPNAALFRKKCIKDYCWDPEYVIGKEHVDFYIGHMKRTEWKFGVCPTIHFKHCPGGDTNYIENRENHRKLLESRNYFLDKWGYRNIVLGYTEWQEPSVNRPSWEHIFADIYKKSLLSSPTTLQNLIMVLRNRVRRFRSRPPI